MSFLKRLFGGSNTLKCAGCQKIYSIGDDSIVVTDEDVRRDLYNGAAVISFSDGSNPVREDLVASFDVKLPSERKNARRSWKIVTKSMSRGQRRRWKCRACNQINDYSHRKVEPPAASLPADIAEFSRGFVNAFSKHIEKMVGSSNDEMRRFVNEYLSPEIVTDLAFRAGEKMKLSRLDGLEHSFSLIGPKVAYTVSTLPFEYVKARDHFVKNYSGYAEMLGRTVQHQNYQQSQVLCHIVYCQPDSGVPWVNASILRMRGDEFSQLPAGIAVDLLTEQERRKIGL